MNKKFIKVYFQLEENCMRLSFNVGYRKQWADETLVWISSKIIEPFLTLNALKDLEFEESCNDPV